MAQYPDNREKWFSINQEAGATILKLVSSDGHKQAGDGADQSAAQLHRLLEFSREGQKLMQSIDQFPVPVIAAIRGYCMGGGMDLALACDHRIAAPNAVLDIAAPALGVMTGWGGTQRLPRLIGKPLALQMFLLAEMVKAEKRSEDGAGGRDCK